MVKASRWLPVYWSVGGLFLSAFLVPLFTYPTGVAYPGLPGTLAGVTTGVISAWAFITCPRGDRLPKVCTFLLLLPGLYIGFWCLSRYLMFGWSP